ncbi:MAG: hypothetical protein IGBAC_1610 [Ignavibacteriae bacterium]|nr:MAG: hypothetical protein IGBAC_1610 [Ignavibacteriota bacterium]
MLKINKKKTIYILIVVNFIYSILLSQESIKSNELILKELSAQALESYIQNIQLNESDTIGIRYVYNNNVQFLYDFLIDYLKNKKKYNLKITENIDGNYLEYLINKLEINYSKPYRDKFLGEKRINRNVTIEYSFKFIQNDGQVDVKPITVNYTDTVNYNSLEVIENKLLPLTMAKIPEDSFIEKYTIPIITISTLSIIVYLFFTIRK